MKTERCAAGYAHESKEAADACNTKCGHTPEPSAPQSDMPTENDLRSKGIRGQGMIIHQDAPAEPSQEAGGAERMTPEQFWRDMILNKEYTDIWKFAEAWAAHENQVLREDCAVWKGQCLRVEAELKKPHAALRDQLADYIMRRMKSLADEYGFTAETTIDDADGVGWISVGKKLPEVGGTYLVWREYSLPFKAGFDLGHFRWLEGHQPEWMTSRSQPIKVQFWMPTPSAPGESEPNAKLEAFGRWGELWNLAREFGIEVKL